MTPVEAEHYVAKLMRVNMGITDARVTAASGDGGIDVTSQRVLAQVKHWSQPAGRPSIQQLYGSRGIDHSKEMYFFCSGGYSAQAVAYADQVSIALFGYARDGSRHWPVNAVAERVSRDVSAIKPALRRSDHTYRAPKKYTSAELEYIKILRRLNVEEYRIPGKVIARFNRDTFWDLEDGFPGTKKERPREYRHVVESNEYERVSSPMWLPVSLSILVGGVCLGIFMSDWSEDLRYGVALVGLAVGFGLDRLTSKEVPNRRKGSGELYEQDDVDTTKE